MISEAHEDALRDEIERLESEGYRVINLDNKSPDAIAIKDGRVLAVEVLGQKRVKNKGWRGSWTKMGKRQIYHMFDDVIFKTFRYGGGRSKRR